MNIDMYTNSSTGKVFKKPDFLFNSYLEGITHINELKNPIIFVFYYFIHLLLYNIE